MKSKNFDYYILSRKDNMSENEIKNYNEAFEYWVSFWSDFWKSSDKNQQAPSLSQLHDFFYRQSAIGVIKHKSAFVGMVLQTKYDLRISSIKKLGYFSHYPDQVFDLLKFSKINQLVTHEFLTVNPEWRKTKIGFSVAEWLMALGARTLHHIGGDGSVAIARKDIGIHKLCHKLGWKSAICDISYNGYPCDVILLNNRDSYLNSDLKIEIEHLWSKRIDISGITNSKLRTDDNFLSPLTHKAA